MCHINGIDNMSGNTCPQSRQLTMVVSTWNVISIWYNVKHLGEFSLSIVPEYSYVAVKEVEFRSTGVSFLVIIVVSTLLFVSVGGNRNAIETLGKESSCISKSIRIHLVFGVERLISRS